MGDKLETALELCAIGLGCYVLHLLVVLVHELGHAVAARLLGFQTSSVNVGPFRFDQKTGFSIRLRWGNLLGGLIVNQFRKVSESAAEARAFGMIAAGPMFNLIFGALLDILAPSHGIPSEIAGFLILDSALFGILNLIPTKKGIHQTDGYKLCSLLFSVSRRRQMMFSLSIRARLDEVKQYCRTDNFPELLRVTEELIRHTDENPALLAQSKWIELLSKLKARAIQGRGNPGEDLSVTVETA